MAIPKKKAKGKRLTVLLTVNTKGHESRAVHVQGQMIKGGGGRRLVRHFPPVLAD
jgi:hypothetical protein